MKNKHRTIAFAIKNKQWIVFTIFLFIGYFVNSLPFIVATVFLFCAIAEWKNRAKARLLQQEVEE